MTQDNSWCQSAKHKTSLLVGFHTIAIEHSSWNPFWRGSARSQKWIAMQPRSTASSLLSKLFHHEYITPALHSHWKTLTKSNIIQRRKIFTAFFLFSAAMCWLGGETILASYKAFMGPLKHDLHLVYNISPLKTFLFEQCPFEFRFFRGLPHDGDDDKQK